MTASAVPTPREEPGPHGRDGATRVWSPAAPTDVQLTLGVLGRGPGDPTVRAEGDGAVWRASRTPAGPGTVRVVREAERRVRATAWGQGASWLLEQLPELLGAGDDARGFAPRHRVVLRAHRDHPGLRLCRTGLVLESLIPSVLEQKVTSVEAYRAWRLLVSRFGSPAPGPVPDGMRVPPEPGGWARIPSWEWHRAGVDAKRSGTVVRVARLARRLEEAAAMSVTEAVRRLCLAPGVGPWTAAETVQRTHGAADLVTTGDLHLPRQVGWALARQRDVDDAGMLRLLAPYQGTADVVGQRHRVCRLVLLGGPRLPRRAPRQPVRDFRAM